MSKENQDQRSERLVLELQRTFTVEDDQGQDFVQFYQASVKERQAFCLFRVFNEDLWMTVLHGLLDFEAGQGFVFKVTKRYLKMNKRLGFLWEVTIDGDNLEEAVDTFRQLLMSCMHLVLGLGSEPTYEAHEKVEAALRSEHPPQPDVSPRRPIKARRPRRRERDHEESRGVIDPESVNPDGSFTGRLPQQVEGVAAGMDPDKAARVTGMNEIRDPKKFKVNRGNERERIG